MTNEELEKRIVMLNDEAKLLRKEGGYYVSDATVIRMNFIDRCSKIVINCVTADA